MIGETLGSYEVRKRIGEGGMGEVYLAEHKHMGRMAAIKVLRPQFSGEAELVGRFFAEARSTNLVKHPGIVQVYDCAVHTNGRAYIVMEYLEGQTLGAALEQLGCVDEVMTIVDLSWQIATALQAAHNKDIIHRDLKPDNIFLTFLPEQGPNPVVKILDFGIAKLLHSKVKATQTGSMLGTPLYMSPEQGRGAGLVDHRTDIYALGCIMFEMVCGRPPFVREGAGELIIAHASEIPPPASKIQPSLPPELDQLISRMLAKRAEDRPQSMQEVATVLDMYRAHTSATAATDPFIPNLPNSPNLPNPDDGQTSRVRPRKLAPTEILPPSEMEFRRSATRHPMQGPMPGKNSWLARARETSHGVLPARAAVRVQPPSTLSSYASDAEAPHPVSSRSHVLLWIAGGVLAAVAVVLVVTLTRTEPVAKVEPQTTPSVEVVLPILAPSSPRPVAEPAPVVPAVAATGQSPATTTAGTSPEKAKRQPSGQPPSDIERSRKRVGAESMEAAQTAFSHDDFIAAGVQAKRAARYGFGVRAYLLLAESMMRLRSYHEAQQAYESVLALDPNNSVAKLGLNVCKRHTSP